MSNREEIASQIEAEAERLLKAPGGEAHYLGALVVAGILRHPLAQKGLEILMEDGWRPGDMTCVDFTGIGVARFSRDEP